MNGLKSITQWQTYFGNPSGGVLGVVNAAQSIGSVVSLPVVGLLSDKIGRRWTLFSGAVVIFVASAIQAASVQYGMFVFSRYTIHIYLERLFIDDVQSSSRYRIDACRAAFAHAYH